MAAAGGGGGGADFLAVTTGGVDSRPVLALLASLPPPLPLLVARMAGAVGRGLGVTGGVGSFGPASDAGLAASVVGPESDVEAVVTGDGEGDFRAVIVTPCEGVGGTAGTRDPAAGLAIGSITRLAAQEAGGAAAGADFLATTATVSLLLLEEAASAGRGEVATDVSVPDGADGALVVVGRSIGLRPLRLARISATLRRSAFWAVAAAAAAAAAFCADDMTGGGGGATEAAKVNGLLAVAITNCC